MASDLSPEVKARLEDMVAKAEPLPENDEFFDRFDGHPSDEEMDRALATLAKKALEGRLK